MKCHVFLAHPEAKSFNATLARTTRQVMEARGWQVTLSDLYAMSFDPREGARHYTSRADREVSHTQCEQRFNADQGTTPKDAAAEIEKIMACDLMVVHFPFWWFGMPAILKGWMDRTFVYGKMYRSARRYDAGFCAGKKGLACVTTGESENSCSHNGKEGDTHLHLWPLLFPYRYLGFDVLEPVVFHGIGGVSFMENREDELKTLASYKAQWARVLETLPSRSTLKFNRDDDFVESKRLVPDAPVNSPFVRQTSEAV